jgi:imidazolonepropionase
MASLLLDGIGELVTNDPAAGDPATGDEGDETALGLLREAAVIVVDDRIAWVGASAHAPDADERLDLDGRAVLPGFVDSHSHLVFAGDRSAEFAARMSGTPYDGGGIASTVRATRETGDATLRQLVGRRVAEMRAQGTTTVEIKSGYGLSVEQEARALRIAREFTDEVTFLGAHVVPPGIDRRDYLDLVTGPMLSACAPLARWADVFCEPGSPHAFDADEAEAVLTAAARAGLLLRVHGNQLGHGPGIRLAVELGAAAVDHCTFASDADVEALAASRTVATLLPGVEFSTRSPYPSARRMIDAGVTVALATDCNPGTSYTTSMPLMVALAVREMGMTPAEAVWSVTAGGAAALRREDIGRIRPGARADLAVLDAPSYRHLAYRVGVPLASTLLAGGSPAQDRD